MKSVHRHLLVVPLLLAILTACEPREKLTPEPWAASAPSEWPQIVLSHSAYFRGHSPLRGASAFLFRTKRGLILAGTARHLIGENAGVGPSLEMTELDAALQTWILFPRTMEERSVGISGLGSASNGGDNNDWLILRLASAADLPATPLRMRSKPVDIGEMVHLIGVSYDEPRVAQKVYSGKVTKREREDRFRFDVAPPVDLKGFAGAPIVDDAGLLVGVMTLAFNTHMVGDLYMEAGGEDTKGALEMLAP